MKFLPSREFARWQKLAALDLSSKRAAIIFKRQQGWRLRDPSRRLLSFACVTVQGGHQSLTRRRRGHGTIKDDVLGGNLFPIQPLVGVVVRTNRRAFERDAREQTARARIAEHFRAHGYIRRR